MAEEVAVPVVVVDINTIGVTMKANQLKKIINTIVREEVKKQLGEIFINEIKSKKSTPIQESVKTKEEYPTLGGGTFDTSRMSELLGYGDMNQEDLAAGNITWQVQNLHVYERHFDLVK